MFPQNTFLDFEVLPTYNCATLAIADTSYYNPNMVISGGVLQVLVPGYITPVDLAYTQGTVNIFNSNTLGITNVLNSTDLVPIPDGAYTIKMSICPSDFYWTERTFYRTCQIECKYDEAILLLDLNNCSTCYNKDLWQQIQRARTFIEGCKSNANSCNIRNATECYNVANKILDTIIECKCWSKT